MTPSAGYAVYARYFLLFASARLSAGGWLPPEITSTFAADPVVIEQVAGLIGVGVTLAWYWTSRARKALNVVVDYAKDGLEL